MFVCDLIKPAEALPTYCDFIDLYTEFGSDDHILCAEISKHFPSISVKCPGCVADTVSRIIAPATTVSLNIRTEVNRISTMLILSACLETTNKDF